MEAKNIEKKDDSKEIGLRMAAEVIISTLERVDERKDPGVRHLIVLDKLLTLIDIAMSAYIINANDVSQDTKDRILTATNMIKGKIKDLEEWVEQPYRLDHPYGNQIMKKAEEDFNSKAETLESNDDI